MAYNTLLRPGLKRPMCLATCSEDETIFLFEVTSEDTYTPICFIPLRHVPRHVVWSHDAPTSDHMMVTCDDGYLIEMVAPTFVSILFPFGA